MILVLALAATLWGVGSVMRAPNHARWLMIGVLYLAVLAIQLTFSDAHPLRLATGESPALWLLLGGFAAVFFLYRGVLSKLRRAASEPDTPSDTTDSAPFTDTELNRYARHIVLREIGGPGQLALKNARVLVIGAGGLGAPVLQYLTAAGVGTIGVIDDDDVEGSNLQRQVIHRDSTIGMPKVFSAQAAMQELNPFVRIKPYHRRLTAEIADDLFSEYDVIVDGSDNYETRYLTNAAAVRSGKPLVSGAISQWEGQMSVFHPAESGPCYACVFPQRPDPQSAPSCAQAGVISPLPGVVGSMMALETIKVITGAGTLMRGKMMIFDGLFGESRFITITPRNDCPICAQARAGFEMERTAR